MTTTASEGIVAVFSRMSSRIPSSMCIGSCGSRPFDFAITSTRTPANTTAMAPRMAIHRPGIGGVREDAVEPSVRGFRFLCEQVALDVMLHLSMSFGCDPAPTSPLPSHRVGVAEPPSESRRPRSPPRRWSIGAYRSGGHLKSHPACLRLLVTSLYSPPAAGGKGFDLHLRPLNGRGLAVQLDVDREPG